MKYVHCLIILLSLLSTTTFAQTHRIPVSIKPIIELAREGRFTEALAILDQTDDLDFDAWYLIFNAGAFRNNAEAMARFEQRGCPLKVLGALRQVLVFANKGDWKSAFRALDEIGEMTVGIWNDLLGEAIRQDDTAAAAQILERGRAVDINESTQFAVRETPIQAEQTTLDILSEDRIVFTVPYTPIAPANNDGADLDSALQGTNAEHRAGLQEVATVLNFNFPN